MNSFRVFDREIGQRLTVVTALIVAAVVPALAPMLASAATVTERSIALSTSAKGATGVTYDVKFKAATNGTGAFVLDFCEDSPIVGDACDGTITGFTTAGVATSGGHTATSVDANSVNVTLGASVDADDEVNVTLTGINNPSAAGPLYARIVTYTDAAAVTAEYVSETDLGTFLDNGGAALSITDAIGVTGKVRESLIFCASGTTIDPTCGGTLTPPSLALGTDGILEAAVSEGSIYSQISTNAATGAVVNLKSNAVGCGGLVRAGAPSSCDITPVTTPAAISSGAAKFGLKIGTVANGSGTIAGFGSYGPTNFFLDYVSGDATGVTSTYGSPVYSTNNLPISNGAVELTFGANAGNDTPAGNYSATLNLIATGKF